MQAPNHSGESRLQSHRAIAQASPAVVVRRPKRVVFATVAVVTSLVAALMLLAAADALLRRHYAATIGLNRWGYRGALAGKKAPAERRVVMLGGSTVFGFGVSPAETVTTFLERRLQATSPEGVRISVVNLGYPKEGAWSFRSTLADYAYLEYDVAILYEGYNDLRRLNLRAFRRDSPIFRMSGYLPLLPLVLEEKARAIRYGGDLDERFGREDPVFRPSLADKAASGTLKVAAETTRALERVLGPLAGDRAGVIGLERIRTCGSAFQHYCASVLAGVEEALAHGARVLVVTQPHISDTHVLQQRHMAASVRERFGRDPRVAYLDLGTAVDLRDPAVAWDGMHLVPSGNATIAERLAAPVARLLGAR